MICSSTAQVSAARSTLRASLRVPGDRKSPQHLPIAQHPVSVPAGPGPFPAREAIRQLRLRHQLAATVSDTYFQAGFTVIVQDVILGAHLTEMTAMIHSRPLLVIVLAPQISIITDQEQGRGKTAYGTWAIAQLDDILRHETPRLGFWLDTSYQAPAETTDEILSRAWEEARIPRLNT